MDSNKDILLFLGRMLSDPPEDTVLAHLLKAHGCMTQTENPGENLMNRVVERMNLGQKRYGHGIRLHDDTRQWGTKKNSWMEMCEEEIIDGIIYAIADHLRRK
jgi:hypothetical protein